MATASSCRKASDASRGRRRHSEWSGGVPPEHIVKANEGPVFALQALNDFAGDLAFIGDIAGRGNENTEGLHD